jgi:hypothetical protein
VKPANRKMARTGSILGSLNCFTFAVPSGTSSTVNFLENNKTLQKLRYGVEQITEYDSLTPV